MAVRDAAADTKGVASFSDTNFAVDDGAVALQTWHQDARVFGSIIKILPIDFMSNEEGGLNKSEQFDVNGTLGVRATADNAELFAFVAIPQGRTATSVTIEGSDTGNVVHVYNLNIGASAALGGTDGTGNNITHASGCVVGTACNIDDTAATATNYLAIEVVITSYANDIVYGGLVTLA